VHMAPAAKLFKRLKAARLDNTLEAEMRRLAGVELLILDDYALQPLACKTRKYRRCTWLDMARRATHQP
jgi:DNA replication protein DnaC